MNWKGFLIKYGRVIVPAIIVTAALITSAHASMKNINLFIEGMTDNC